MSGLRREDPTHFFITDGAIKVLKYQSYFLTAFFCAFLTEDFPVALFLDGSCCFLLIFNRSRLISLLPFLTRVASFFSPTSCLSSTRAPVTLATISFRTGCL